jgi:thiol:disulfide interchange protein DsbD
MRALLLLLLCGPTSSARSQFTPPQDRPAPPRVSLRLLSELDALKPGEEFWIGAEYKLEPHWHIYWKNPGDSGLATEASLEAPSGFEVGPLLFPGPERIVLPGDMVSYGYEDEVVLFWRVTAPNDLGEATSFEFKARSEWLVCRDLCARGDGEAQLELRRAGDEETLMRDVERFGASLARLPQPLAALDGAVARWEGSEDAPVLVLQTSGPTTSSFFPESEPGLDLERASQESGEERSSLRRWYSFRPSEKHPRPRVRGLLAIERDERTAFYELDLTRPRADEKETR